MADISNVTQSVANKFNFNTLKPFQERALIATVCDKKDVFVSVRTGSGKSLCFQGISTVCEELGRDGIVIVISPLVSLMQSQVANLNKLGIAATFIGKDCKEDNSILAGEFTYVYSSPENLLGPRWRAMLQSEVYRRKLSCLVFDEAHTAVSWGLQKGEEQAFREDFSRVGELRASVPNCPLMALTATASPAARKSIKSLLAMKDPVEFIESPDRENIKISVVKLSGDTISSFKWLAEKLNRDGQKCEKTLIYCRRISDCSNLYRFMREEVEDQSLFEMYHSRTVQRVKDKVLDSINDQDSEIRVVIATNAVGMGLDFSLNCVVNFGPPSEFDAYLQQIGRVGRNGCKSHAILAYHGQQLRKVSPEMMAFVKTERCRRSLLRNLYGSESMKAVCGCRCCDICEITCECDHCEDNRIPLQPITTEEIVSLERHISSEEKTQLEVHLLALKNDLDLEAAVTCAMYSDFVGGHGLSPVVIQRIVSKAQFVFSIDDLLEKCGILKYDTAVKIMSTFSGIFGDTDTDIVYEEDILS